MTQDYTTPDPVITGKTSADSTQFDSFLKKFDNFVISVNKRFDSIDNRFDAVETLVKENKASISSLCKVFDAVISDKAA